MSTTRFPGESPAYRESRDALLKAEIELKKQTEAVAALRRRLPIGGEVAQDYAFEEGPADPEMLYASDRAKDGVDSRHIDIMWPLWNVLDLTPEGRGDKTYPALRYPDERT